MDNYSRILRAIFFLTLLVMLIVWCIRLKREFKKEEQEEKRKKSNLRRV